MSSRLPWDDLSVPNTDYHVRMVGDAVPVPTYWARDPDGRYALILSLPGDHVDYFVRNQTTVRGIEADLRQDVQPGAQRLVLTLQRQSDGDLFLALCNSLFAEIEGARGPDTVLEIVLSLLRRWKAFLAGGNARLLTWEEIRGLFAELTFLRELYTGQLDKDDAVVAWVGPEQTHQDFVYADRAVEVKSLSARDPSTIRISSEDQLETVQGELFLLAYRLAESSDAGTALSLNDLVDKVSSDLRATESLTKFETKLALVGYTPVREYSLPRFVVVGVQSYRVTDGFPRLIRSELPLGLTRVNYQIHIEAISPYACPMNIVSGGA